MTSNVTIIVSVITVLMLVATGIQIVKFFRNPVRAVTAMEHEKKIAHALAVPLFVIFGFLVVVNILGWVLTFSESFLISVNGICFGFLAMTVTNMYISPLGGIFGNAAVSAILTFALTWLFQQYLPLPEVWTRNALWYSAAGIALALLFRKRHSKPPTPNVL